MNTTNRSREEKEASLWIEAARMGDLEAMKAMAAAGCEMDARDEWGDTALKEAAAHGMFDVLVWLFEAGAQVNASNDVGINALMYAASAGEHRSVEFLLKAGSELDRRSEEGMMALMYAIFASYESADELAGSKKCLLLLLQAGCDLAKVDSDGKTAELQARSLGHLELAEMICAERERRELEKLATDAPPRSARHRV